MTHSFTSTNHLFSRDELYQTELTFLTKQLRELIHAIFWDLGIEVTYKDHPIHQIYQDFIVCTQHYLLRIS
jgi:mRNA-degrading endonuclease YafQ of YafQ-DinJ toxin-antitoxin module